MKTIVSILALTVLSSAVFAIEDKPKASVGVGVMKSGTSVKVFYRGEKKSNVKVAIMNEDGRLVFSELLKDTDNFMRPYDLSKMQAGEYTISLHDADGIRTEKVKIGYRTALPSMRLVALKKTPGKYMLRVPNKKSERLQIRIFNKGNVVYEGLENISGDFAKVYDLSKFAGDFSFEVKDRDGYITSLTSGI